LLGGGKWHAKSLLLADQQVYKFKFDLQPGSLTGQQFDVHTLLSYNHCTHDGLRPSARWADCWPYWALPARPLLAKIYIVSEENEAICTSASRETISHPQH